MLEAKLFGYKKIKLGGVGFVIKKLTPSLFMDREYLFPLSPYIEALKQTGRPPKEFELKKKLEEQKQRIKDVFLKSVVEVKYFLKSKKIQDVIDDIMEREFLYSALLTAIIEHSLGLKKKHFRLFRSIEPMRQVFSK